MFNVLSLFDGCGMAFQALKNAGIKVNNYYASEVDKYAISVAKNQHPEIIQLGDINNIGVYAYEYPDCDCCGEPYCHKHFSHFSDCDCIGVSQLEDLNIDFVIFGSPCTNLSSGKWFAKTNGVGFEGDSKLFYKAVELLKLIQPKYFLMENVASMKKEHRDIISKELGVEPVKIDSRAFLPQMRKRLYWCNWKVEVPKIQKHDLNDYLINNLPPELYNILSDKEMAYMNATTKAGRTRWSFANHSDTAEGYTKCLTANLKRGVPYNVLIDRRYGTEIYRKFRPFEIEALQGLRHGYSAFSNHGKQISDYQRFKMLGNGFNVPTIEYIIKQNNNLC